MKCSFLKKTQGSLVLAVAVILLMNPQAAIAQDVADNEYAFEEIVVSARKRDELLADVPESIAVLTTATIEKSGFDNIEDIQNLVPNFSIVNTQNPGTIFINVRGVGQFRNSDAPVAIVVDGVQLTSPNQIDQELFDLQQIEILKGPQGALYGRNAVAGAINIVTKQPTDEFEGRVSAGYGNGDDMNAMAVVSGAIIEGILRGRVGATFREYDGLIVGSTLGVPVDFVEDKSIRGRLIYEPSENFVADFRIGYSNMDAGSSYWATPISENGFFLDDQANNFSFPVSTDVLGNAQRELQDYALRIDYDFGEVLLTSVTSRSNVDEFFEQDLDFISAPVFSVDQDLLAKTFSQELRLASNGDSQLDWSFGAYYLDTKRDVVSNVYGAPLNIGGYYANIGISNLDYTQSFIPLSQFNTTDNNVAYAVFGNASYEISEAIKLSVGLRYDVDERRQVNNATSAILEETFDQFQPKVNLLWKVSDDVSTYASWGVGFRSGGFNADPLVRASYEAEKIESYEVGFKATGLGGEISGAVFLNDFTNRQDFIFIAGIQTILTTPTASIQGLELAYRSRPVGDFTFSISGGLQDGKVGENPLGFTPDIMAIVGLPAGTDFTDNELPLVYGWSLSANVDFSHEFNNGVELFARTDLSMKGDMYWELSNFDDQDTLYMLNLRAGLRFEGFEFTAWVENLLDRKFYTELTSAEFTALPVDQGFPGQPRRYGLIVTKRF